MMKYSLFSTLVDVVSIPKTIESFRLLYDTKGRFRLHSLKDEEAKVFLDMSTNETFLLPFKLCKFDVRNVAMVTGGRNTGRVGILKNREKHKGIFETVHIQDASGHEFATIRKGSKPWLSLLKGKGIKSSIIEDVRKRRGVAEATA
ncbi:40S ribosomal protein S4 [Tanacetum coccineum]